MDKLKRFIAPLVLIVILVLAWTVGARLNLTTCAR